MNNMAKIGSFGGVSFEVSPKKVLTFNEFSRSGASKWGVHEVNNKKPLPEFLGPDLEEITFNIRLSSLQGVDPEKELKKLRSFRDNGKVASFILGTKPITSNYWYIDSISEGHKTISNSGRSITIEVELHLKEYPKIIIPKPKKTVKKTTPKKNTNVSTKKTIGKVKVKVAALYIRATPSMNGKILKVAKKNETFHVYEKKTTDITWYSLGAGRWISAGANFVSFSKGV